MGALAARPLNGRQIKNALQLALALARRDGTELSQAHLEATLELSTAFARAVGADEDFEAVPGDGGGAELQAAVQEATARTMHPFASARTCPGPSWLLGSLSLSMRQRRATTLK